MFVISVKSKALKNAALAVFAVALAAIGAVYFVGTASERPVSKQNGVILRAGTAEERTAFFSQFGWEIAEDPVCVKEVIIPPEFDETYQKYNELQKQQGLDLEKYKGARVKHWSFKIKNYPGYENDSEKIRGNILVLDGIVVGGDISSTPLDGFMHTFWKPEGTEETSVSP